MSNAGAAPRAAVSTSHARAEASRKNGAKSRGPRTAEGKARSAQNALKHGLRAAKYVLLPDEDAAGFAALEAALLDELAPDGVLQTIVVQRVARAAWRLERAERLEVELFAEWCYGGTGPGLALIRDGNGTRSFETLLRYRGAAQAELWRALRTLKALQAEPAAPRPASAAEPAAMLMLQPARRRSGAATLRQPTERAGEPAPRAHPIEPEPGGNPGDPGPLAALVEPEAPAGPACVRTNDSEPAPRGVAYAPAARRSTERTRSWAGGDGAASETDGARTDCTGPGAPDSDAAAGPQSARSTP